MLEPNYILLYVNDPIASEKFYSDLLGLKPVESSPTFALFVLSSGVKFGLWSKHTVEPAATLTGGGCEIAISVADNDAVEALHTEWSQRGLTILQPPTDLDFGHTFVALDPDAHRIRVLALHHTD